MFSVHWSISCMCTIYWWHVYQISTKTMQNKLKLTTHYTFCRDGDIRLSKARNYEHWTLISRRPALLYALHNLNMNILCFLVTYSCRVWCCLRDKVGQCLRLHENERKWFLHLLSMVHVWGLSVISIRKIEKSCLQFTAVKQFPTLAFHSNIQKEMIQNALENHNKSPRSKSWCCCFSRNFRLT